MEQDIRPKNCKTWDKRFRATDEIVSIDNIVALSPSVFLRFTDINKGKPRESGERILRIVVTCVYCTYIRYSRKQSKSVAASRRHILPMASTWRNARLETRSGRDWAGRPFPCIRILTSLSFYFSSVWSLLANRPTHCANPRTIQPITTERRVILRATNPRRVVATPARGVHGRCPKSACCR